MSSFSATAFTIYLGSVSLDGDDPNRMILATNDYEIHPEFNPETLENDVGLVKLRMEITYYTSETNVARVGEIIVFSFLLRSVRESSAIYANQCSSFKCVCGGSGVGTSQ